MTSKANSDVDQATAGATGTTSAANQQTSGAGAVTRDFSETGHKMATDVNTEETISTYNGLAVQRALRNQDVFDNLTTQLLQNAIETANMLSKQAVRHVDLATDRIWNVNETDAYSVQAIKAVADIIRGE